MRESRYVAAHAAKRGTGYLDILFDKIYYLYNK
jgi:hypothetical protein